MTFHSQDNFGMAIIDYLGFGQKRLRKLAILERTDKVHVNSFFFFGILVRERLHDLCSGGR
jgi:hypothetical protein